MIIIIILIYTLIGIFEIKPLIKKKEFGKCSVYSIFFLAAFVVSILLVAGVKIPSPSIIMEKIIYPITGQP